MIITKFPLKINEELAEETGWHIGDGTMNYYQKDGKKCGFYQLRGHIEDDKLHYIKRIKPVFKSLYGIDINLRKMPSTRVFGFQIWNNELVKFKQNLGLPLGRKLELQIPSTFLAKKEYIVSCIRGIFDTDGCIYLEKKNGKLYPRIEIFTISNILAQQLSDALIALDFRTTKYLSQKPGRVSNKLPGYKISVRGVNMLHKFVDIISPKNPKHLAKYNKLIQSFK